MKKLLAYTVAERYHFKVEDGNGEVVNKSTVWCSNKRLYLTEEAVNDAIKQMQECFPDTEYKKVECMVYLKDINELI